MNINKDIAAYESYNKTRNFNSITDSLEKTSAKGTTELQEIINYVSDLKRKDWSVKTSESCVTLLYNNVPEIYIIVYIRPVIHNDKIQGYYTQKEITTVYGYINISGHATFAGKHTCLRELGEIIVGIETFQRFVKNDKS